jgi:hypothetical protein
MELYMNAFESYSQKKVYHFTIGDGGIGDYIKFFMFVLEDCMQKKIRLYLKRNNIELENYIQLNYAQMYTDCSDSYVTPQHFYSYYHTNFSIPIKDVFHFTDEVKQNSIYLFPYNRPYVSIHLRMGDYFLETDKQYVYCHNDIRAFSENKINETIETIKHSIFLCCDNNSKLKIKEKYPFLIVTDCTIGHTSFSNTTKQQVLDAVTEFYILTNSEMIYGITNSGFSLMASKFNNIPYFCETV